jgi:hypothetical protein
VVFSRATDQDIADRVAATFQAIGDCSDNFAEALKAFDADYEGYDGEAAQ